MSTNTTPRTDSGTASGVCRLDSGHEHSHGDREDRRKYSANDEERPPRGRQKTIRMYECPCELPLVAPAQSIEAERRHGCPLIASTPRRGPSPATFSLRGPPIGDNKAVNPRRTNGLSRAGNGTRTRDPNLGKVVLYQLSYSRIPSSTNGVKYTRLHPPYKRRNRPYMAAGRYWPAPTPSACTAYQTLYASSPERDASPPFPIATPSASSSSAATPLSSGASRSHASADAASGPTSRAHHCTSDGTPFRPRCLHGPPVHALLTIQCLIQRQPQNGATGSSSRSVPPRRSAAAASTALPPASNVK